MLFRLRLARCILPFMTALFALAAPIALTGCESTSTPDTTRTEDYYLGIWAKAFNLKLYFKSHLVMSGDLTAGGTIKTFEMRALVPADGSVTEVIFLSKDVTVATNGTFLLLVPKIVLPAKASPTGTDVELELKLTGKFNADGTFCGTVDGNVPAFATPLTGSTFKAVKWGKETKPIGETSCEGNVAKLYTHISQCPTVSAGANTMTSAERKRTFQVMLPATGTPTTDPMPIVFLYHGVGGDPKGILDESQFAKLLETEKFILVVPESERDTAGKAVLKTDWYYAAPQYDLDNPDLVYFDDLLGCVGKQYKIDAARVYVTGMSGGGLISTFTALNRGKVVAAAAPFSGGYLNGLDYPKDEQKTPFLVTWGGPTDKAYEQNFETLAATLSSHLAAVSHPLVKCEHALGHKWPKEMTTPAWQFLHAYELGKAGDPWAAGLPASFPAYCKIAK